MAARVRELVGEPAPTARVPPREGPGDGADNWLPDDAFDRHVPRHGAARHEPEEYAAAGSAGGGASAGGSSVHRAVVGARTRWDPGRRGAAALGVAVVVLLMVAGWWVASSRPTEVPVGTTSPVAVSASGSWLSSPAAPSSVEPTAGGAPAGSVDASATVAAQVVVDVAGRVRRPGVYRLVAGARVFDALRAAGGVRDGVSTVTLNLAATLQDGEQILVGVGGHSSVTGGGAVVTGSAGVPTDSSGASGTPVDLNTATLEQLETLPGIGPALGQRILDWRAAHGSFTGVDQLNDVSGIGDVRMTQLRPLVTV